MNVQFLFIVKVALSTHKVKFSINAFFIFIFSPEVMAVLLLKQSSYYWKSRKKTRWCSPCARLRQPVVQRQVFKNHNVQKCHCSDRVWDVISCFSVTNANPALWEKTKLRDFRLQPNSHGLTRTMVERGFSHTHSLPHTYTHDRAAFRLCQDTFVKSDTSFALFSVFPICNFTSNQHAAWTLLRSSQEQHKT